MTAPYTTPDIVAKLPATGYTPVTNSIVEVPTTAKLMIGLDVSDQLVGMALPQNYNVTLTSASGSPIEMAEPAGLSWYTITQVVDGSLLTAEHGYTLAFQWTDESGQGFFIGHIKIRCPF